MQMTQTQILLEYVGNRNLYRKHVAEAYSRALHHQITKVDWKTVNAAIVKRWSQSGLEYIKRLAWRKSDA